MDSADRIEAIKLAFVEQFESRGEMLGKEALTGPEKRAISEMFDTAVSVARLSTPLNEQSGSVEGDTPAMQASRFAEMIAEVEVGGTCVIGRSDLGDLKAAYTALTADKARDEALDLTDDHKVRVQIAIWHALEAEGITPSNRLVQVLRHEAVESIRSLKGAAK